MVHKAVVLPLCPYLSVLSQSSDGREDGKVVFTDVPLEVVKSVVQLIYTGQCNLSPVASVTSILEMMKSLGLFIQPHRLEVVESSEVVAPKLSMSRREYLYNSEVAAHEDAKNQKEALMNDTIEHVVSMANRFADETIEDAHDVGKFFDVTDAIRVSDDQTLIDENCNSVKSVFKDKVKEPRFFCEHCDYKNRFYNQLIEHASVIHSEKKFSCEKCDFKFKNLMCLKKYKKTVHNGAGKYPCDFCEFSAHNPSKLKWHKKLHHKKSERSDGDTVSLQMRQPRKSKKSASSSMKEISRPQSRVAGRKYNPEGIFHCHACDFRTMFIKSLGRHMKRFHEENC